MQTHTHTLGGEGKCTKTKVQNKISEFTMKKGAKKKMEKPSGIEKEELLKALVHMYRAYGR